MTVCTCTDVFGNIMPMEVLEAQCSGGSSVSRFIVVYEMA